MTRFSILQKLKEQYAGAGHLRNSTLGVLAVAGAFDQMSVTIIAPFLPIYAKQFTGDLTLIGLLFAAETITMAILAVPCGYLSDVIGRKRLITGGMVLGAVGVVGLGFANSLLGLVVFRVIDGVGSAMRIPTTKAYLGDLIPEEERGSAMGAYRSVEKLGVFIGPGLGGLIVSFATIQTAFLTLGWGTFIAGLLCLFYLPSLSTQDAVTDGSDDSCETDDSQETDDSDRSFDLPTATSFGLKRRVLTPPVMALAVVTLLLTVGFGAFNTLLPLLLEQDLGASPSIIGYLWTFSGLVSLVLIPICGSFVDSRGRKSVFALGSTVWIVIPFSFAIITTLLIAPILMIMNGLVSALISTSKATLDYETPPADVRGTALGLFSSMSSIGVAIGPVIGGYVAETLSIDVMMELISVLAIISLILLLWKVPAPMHSDSKDSTTAGT